MRTESHISVTRTHVREGELARHAAGRWEGGRVFAATSGLGLPRTWPLATSAVLRGLERAVEETKGARGIQRALGCAEKARAELAETCDHLVERMLPDASLAAIFLDGGEMHVVAAGAARVYLHRGGKPQRLTPRDEPTGGVLRARLAECTTPVEPGDLILAGSASAFSMRAISHVVGVLSQDPRTAPSVLASLLTEPAGQAGVGAVAIVLRIA